jgi:hypothetical protein
MAYTTIKKPSDYFNTKLYSGNSSTNAITGVGHQPDLTWIKRRNSAEGHIWIDSVRGVDKRLGSNVTSAESTVTYFTSFDTDGFTVNGTNIATNVSGGTFTAWNWKANGTASSNTDGSITSTVSANTTSGFSIGTYSGNSTTGATVGHSLGSAPSMVIVKKTNSTGDWYCYHSGIGATKFIKLNDTAASATNTLWNDTAPTSSVFSMDNNSAVNGSSDSYVFYAFAEKKGFSKFGSYTGNGNADGTFVYTGFKPAFVLVRHTDSVGENWFICDNKREGYNAENNRLMPNINSVEINDSPIDILSNGFKARETGNKVNGSGRNYIYMAFAEEPLVGDNPATAR